MNRILFSILFLLLCAVYAQSQVTTQNARRTPTGSGAPGSGGSAPPVACTSGPPFGTDYTDTSTTLPTIYKCKSGSLTATAGGTTGAPKDATYIVETPNGTLNNEFALNSLTDGLLKHASGVPARAIPGTDYVATETDPVVKAINGIVKSNGSTIAAAGASDLPSGIDAAKIGGGGVSTTEFDFLGTITSNVQTQIDGKQATITFGTGVQTALGVNVGSAGAPVLFNGALGSPSSAGTMPAFILGGTVSGGAQALSNIGSIALPIIGPTANSTTAIKFTKADLSSVVGVWDTTNSRLRIGSGVAPTATLDVTGNAVINGSSTVTNTSGLSFFVNSSAVDQFAAEFDNTAASTHSFGVIIKAGTTSADDALRVQSSGGSDYFRVKGDGSVTINGTIASLNGLTTAGNGVAAIAATSPAGLLAQTTAVGPVTVYTTPAADGLYEIFCYISVYSAATSGTITTTLAWTDADSNTGYTTASSALTVNPISQGPINAALKKVKASTAITITTTFSAVVGTPTYSVYVIVKKVG